MMADGSLAIPFLESAWSPMWLAFGGAPWKRGEPGSSGRSGSWNCGLTPHQNSAFQGQPTRVTTEAPRPQTLAWTVSATRLVRWDRCS
jgi:hypothetical protein